MGPAKEKPGTADTLRRAGPKGKGVRKSGGARARGRGRIPESERTPRSARAGSNFWKVPRLRRRVPGFRRRARLLTGVSAALASCLALRNRGGRWPGYIAWRGIRGPGVGTGHPGVTAAATLAARGDALPFPSAASLFPFTSSFIAFSPPFVFPPPLPSGPFSPSLCRGPLDKRLFLFFFCALCFSCARSLCLALCPSLPSHPGVLVRGCKTRGSWTPATRVELALALEAETETSRPSPQPGELWCPPAGTPHAPRRAGSDAPRGSEPPEYPGPGPAEMLFEEHPPQGTRLLGKAGSRARLRGGRPAGGEARSPGPEPKGACSLLPEDAQSCLSRSPELKVPAQAFYGTWSNPRPPKSCKSVSPRLFFFF